MSDAPPITLVDALAQVDQMALEIRITFGKRAEIEAPLVKTVIEPEPNNLEISKPTLQFKVDDY